MMHRMNKKKKLTFLPAYDHIVLLHVTGSASN